MHDSRNNPWMRKRPSASRKLSGPFPEPILPSSTLENVPQDPLPSSRARGGGGLSDADRSLGRWLLSLSLSRKINRVGGRAVEEANGVTATREYSWRGSPFVTRYINRGGKFGPGNGTRDVEVSKRSKGDPLLLFDLSSIMSKLLFWKSCDRIRKRA